MEVTTVQPDNLEQAQKIARKAAHILRSGGLVIFPTETVYGVAASAASSAGIERLRQLKVQGDAQAFTIHLADPALAQRYIDTSNAVLKRLLRKIFPGPVTIVVDVSDDQISERLRLLGLAEVERDHLYYRNTAALRCPDHPLSQQILGALDEPVVAGPANRLGQPYPLEASEAAEATGEQVDLVVDGGRCRYSKPSTVVRIRGDGLSSSVTIERVGVYDERIIRKLMRWTMLLVCSGNTCRSPIAEAICRELVADQRGVQPNELESVGLNVVSAGIQTTAGLHASEEAITAMANQGLDLSCHRSQRLTSRLVYEADVIYGMTEAHCEAIRQLVPDAVDKVQRLDPTGDVEDPIGSGLNCYQRTAELIRSRLVQRLKEHSHERF